VREMSASPTGGSKTRKGNRAQPDKADPGQSGEDVRKSGQGIAGLRERASNPEKDSDRDWSPQSNLGRGTEQGRDK
jgi:hypothetical protein